MGWFKKLSDGLKKTSQKLSTGIQEALHLRKVDETLLQELEDTLLMADFGAGTATDLIGFLRKERFGKEVTADEVKAFLKSKIQEILDSLCQPLEILHSPQVILMVGVNGSGKTTTLAKLAKDFQAQGKKVACMAGDTFRAAAIEQLETWTQRLEIPLYKSPQGADAAGLAYDSYKKAQEEGIEVLLMDTAGRLHTNKGLMDELAKIYRVLQKIDPAVPHNIILVLDGTNGQNAIQQVKLFKECLPLTGLIVTKLDGTAKGGIVVALAQEFNLPIHAIGVGEGADDLQPFNAAQYADAILG